MTAARRTALVVTVVTGLALLAAPALAQPEGWSDPDPVDPMRALLVFLGAPIGIALVLTFLTLAPGLVRQQKDAPSLTAPGRHAALPAGEERRELEA
jgi:hypothetical protein